MYLAVEARYVEYLARCRIFPEMTSQTVGVSRESILTSSGVSIYRAGMDSGELTSNKCIIRFRSLRAEEVVVSGGGKLETCRRHFLYVWSLVNWSSASRSSECFSGND